MATRQLYIVIMIYCMSDFKKSHTTALDANGACSCSSGCNFTQSCIPTDNCRKENVALGKPARISSNFSDTQGPAGPACVAVNGNTGTTYVTDTQGRHPNCIHTADNDHNAWWEVDLGRNYTITDITVYIRESQPERMNGVIITVDGQDCYTFPSGTTSSPVQKQISCTTPRTGSLVKFSRNDLLNICEVQVWVCKDGFFGKNCTESCSSKCRNDLLCDNFYGTCLPGDACSCSSGCNFTQSCIPAGNCQKENVALGKPANMSSSAYSSGSACVAVNGNTETTYPTSQQNLNCIHTSNGPNEWWDVNLGRNYTITDITVYIRKDQPGRMDNLRITVDEKECYNFPSGNTNAQEAKSISCNSPVQGSVVRLSRSTFDYFLNFCEVQVWVCRPGLYGKDCQSQCNCKNNTVCDNYHGSCAAGCSTGYYGSNCTQACGRCKVNSTCDSTSGYCLEGCQVGWKMPMCFEVCSKGYYGNNCSQVCGNCKDDSTCNSTNGQCLAGCKIGWKEPMCTECKGGNYGVLCNQTCGKCMNSMCNASNGVCPDGCQDGFELPFCNETCRNHTYGQNCSLQCGRCNKSAPCDPITGNCTSCEANFQLPKCIDCSSGYYGSNCTKKCGNCAIGTTCNTTNGHCMSRCKTGWEEPMCNVCKAGNYGTNCSETCGKCINSTSCNASDGVCLDGCQDGYEQPFCNETCRNKTYGQNCSMQCGRCNNSTSCNVFNGSCTVCETNFNLSMCTECIHGYYGTNCSIQCGHCKEGHLCNNSNGFCPAGCEDGYELPQCHQTCSSRMYGPNCTKECGHCLEGNRCNETNGLCPDDCDAGYSTSLCNENCPNGTWGIQCNMSCGNCNFYSCRHDNGICEKGCVPGYKGELCRLVDYHEENPPGNDTGLIVGVVFGVVLSVAILVGIVFIVRRNGYGFKARHFMSEGDRTSSHLRSTGDRTSRLDSSSNSLAPLTTGPTANKSTEKPKVAVKPRIRDGTCGPVYENVVLANSSRLDEQPQRQTDGVPSTNDMAVQEDDIFLEDSEQLYGNDELIYATLKSSQNLDQIQHSLVDKLTSGALLQEFKHIKKDLRKPHQIALLPQNIKKNRFKVIVPYDCNRVILRDEFEDGDSTDYINASFVKGVQSDTQYIAAQGPRDNTVTDFWRMVLQERVTDIVMVTSLQEGGKNKCYEYWPAKDTTQTYGPVKVTGLDVQSRAYFYTRTFSLRLSDGTEHKVTQYHFTAWPDHGIPTVTSLVDFWRFVKSRANACGVSAPLLVHCSAGVGRTGTYIGLDIGMDQCLQNGKINVAAIVDRMRDDRTTMVQTPEQYVFLYKALLEAYTGRDTKLSIDQFETVISRSISVFTPNERIDKEFQVVMQMRSLTAEQSHSIAIADENRSKNRSEAILPSDGHIVYLTEHVHKRNQYINAVYMSTFTKSRGAILTQLPLPDTLVDFWRMVFGSEVTTVVSLGDTCDETNIQNFCRYWPLTKDAMQIGPYCVTLKSSSRLGKHLVTYTLTLNKQDVTKTREIQILRYEGWSSEIPDKSEIYQLVEILDTYASVGPIVIQCTDGGAKSGLFCCIRDIISRVTFDHDVDIYMTVRHVQSVKPEAVTKVEQYRFCYEVAQEKVREQNVYANI